jgi:hypothetical protein
MAQDLDLSLETIANNRPSFKYVLNGKKYNASPTTINYILVLYTVSGVPVEGNPHQKQSLYFLLNRNDGSKATYLTSSIAPDHVDVLAGLKASRDMFLGGIAASGQYANKEVKLRDEDLKKLLAMPKAAQRAMNKSSAIYNSLHPPKTPMSATAQTFAEASAQLTEIVVSLHEEAAVYAQAYNALLNESSPF